MTICLHSFMLAVERLGEVIKKTMFSLSECTLYIHLLFYAFILQHKILYFYRIGNAYTFLHIPISSLQRSFRHVQSFVSQFSIILPHSLFLSEKCYFSTVLTTVHWQKLFFAIIKKWIFVFCKMRNFNDFTTN